MGETYFGKASAGNSELVARLRNGGRVWPETEQKVLAFIESRVDALPSSSALSADAVKVSHLSEGHGHAPATTQGGKVNDQ